jgi:hypothetical protein
MFYACTHSKSSAFRMIATFYKQFLHTFILTDKVTRRILQAVAIPYQQEFQILTY